MTPSRLVALTLSCLLTVSLLPWLATSSAAAFEGEEVRHQVLDDFEGTSVYGTPYDTGNSATSSTVRASDPDVAAITIGANDGQVAFGGKSLKLTYDFSQAPALNQISIHGGGTRLGSSTNASGLGMWIYGDASGDTVHVNERPNGGGSVATAPVTVDWTGWRYVEFHFATVNTSTWHQIYSPLVIKAAAGERGPRTLVVDQLTLLYAGEAGAAAPTSPVTTPVTVRAWTAADAAAVVLTDVAPARGTADHPTTPLVSAAAPGPVATGRGVMSIDGATVPATVTAGTISFQVTEPLAPGKHRVRVSYRSPVTVYGTEGLLAGTDWTFTVAAA